MSANANLAWGVPSEILEDVALRGCVDTDGIALVMPSDYTAFYGVELDNNAGL